MIFLTMINDYWLLRINFIIVAANELQFTCEMTIFILKSYDLSFKIFFTFRIAMFSFNFTRSKNQKHEEYKLEIEFMWGVCSLLFSKAWPGFFSRTTFYFQRKNRRSATYSSEGQKKNLLLPIMIWIIKGICL